MPLWLSRYESVRENHFNFDFHFNSISATYEDESGAAAPTEPAEPELETMTLDEYKAAMEAKRLKMEFNIRKPNEGCSDEKWKKTYVLKKKEQTKGEEDDEEGEVGFDLLLDLYICRNLHIYLLFGLSRRLRMTNMGRTRTSFPLKSPSVTAEEAREAELSPDEGAGEAPLPGKGAALPAGEELTPESGEETRSP